MIIVSRNFKKPQLETADTIIGRMYRKMVEDSKNERLTKTDVMFDMKDFPFVKNTIRDILNGRKLIPDNQYWCGATLQIKDILACSKSLSYFDKNSNFAMFVFGFRIFNNDDAEFWVGSNVDEKQLLEENKSFKDILLVQGIEVFPEGQDDGVITHTFSSNGIQWNESWVEHRYRTDENWVLDILMEGAEDITPEFIYGDYGNEDLPFNDHKHCIPGKQKILLTVLNCLRENTNSMEKLQDLLLDIHRSYLERIERQERFLASIKRYSNVFNKEKED